MKYVTIEIQAARSHPDKNVKTYLKDRLLQYKNQKDVYVSFQGHTKLGINPSPKDNSTPMGIYTFPIWYIYKEEFDKIISNSIQKQPYVFVIRKKSNKVLRVDVNIPDSEFSELLEKVKEIFFRRNEKEISKYIYEDGDLKDFIKTTEYQKLLQEDYRYNPNTNTSHIYYLICLFSKNTRQMNYVFQELGYDIVEDKGNAVIHYREPVQTLFLNSSSYSIITMEHASYKEEVIYDWAEITNLGITLNARNWAVLLLDAISSFFPSSFRYTPKNKRYDFRLSLLPSKEILSLIFSMFSFEKYFKFSSVVQCSYTLIHAFYEFLEEGSNTKYHADHLMGCLVGQKMLELVSENPRDWTYEQVKEILDVETARGLFLEESQEQSIVTISDKAVSSVSEKTVEIALSFIYKKMKNLE